MPGLSSASVAARGVAAAALALLLLLGVPARAGESVPPKVDAAAWGSTAAGGTAEVLILMEGKADLSPARALATKEDKGRFVVMALRDVAKRRQAEIRRWLTALDVPFRPYYVVNALWARVDRGVLIALAARADVQRIAPNPAIERYEPGPSDAARPKSLAAIEWNVNLIGAPQLWADGARGGGVVIGTQDTGVRWTHEALKPQYRGWDGVSVQHDYNWHDAIHPPMDGGPCGTDSTFPCDDNGHGTHTIGTAVGGDGNAIGIGVAPGAKWIACRDMDRNVGTPATYLECFEFFLAPYPVGADPSMGDPTRAPDITTNSFLCYDHEGCAWDTLQDAVEAQRAAGIMTIACAGNWGPACSTALAPPALYDATYTVGATTASSTLADFSSRGPALGSGLTKPDIVAPGEGVWSAWNSDDTSYGWDSGTSMATPAVAGGIALLWSARPAFFGKIDETEDLLNLTATRLTFLVEGCGGDYVLGPNNSWGFGLINLASALGSACWPAPETLCADGRDDDCDGRTDCVDSDCVGVPACPERANCTDRVDNDADGLTDCADPDCIGNSRCPERAHCADGLDNDGDGAADCADRDCDGNAACPESAWCSDGADNDRDGLADCADPDCVLDAACEAADTDGDGAPNRDDCLPLDPTVHASAPEVARLDARKAPNGQDVALSWTDVDGTGGAVASYDIASGALATLRDPVPPPPTCLVTGLPALAFVDARIASGSAYFLARATNACGPPPGAGWGTDSMGRDRAGCP